MTKRPNAASAADQTHPSGPQSGPQTGPARADWGAVTFGTAAMILAAYHYFKLPPVLPLMRADFGYPAVLAGAFMSVYAIVGLGFSVVIGRLMQRIGAAPLFILAFAGFLIGGVLILGWPGSGSAVLIGRLLEAVGFAILAIGGPTLVNAHAGPHLAVAIGIGATWIPAGQLLGVAIAQPSLASGLWAPLWWVGLGATVLVAAWTLAVGRRGKLAVAGGRGRQAATLDREQRRALVVSGIVFGLWSLQFIAYMTWLPTYLVEVTGLTGELAVLGYAVPVATLLVLNLVAGYLLRRGWRLAPMLAVALVSQALVWAALPWTGAGWDGIVSLIVYGIGAGVAPTCLWALPAAVSGGAASAGAFGVVMTGRNVGALAGPLVLAVMVAGQDWEWAAGLFTLVNLAAALGAGWLFSRLRAF
jgi:MFS family permease